MELFRLFGSVFVNTDAADESMQKTEKNAESVASKLGAGVATAAKFGAAIVSGAAVAGGAMMGVANDTAAAADAVDKASIRMNVSAEYYQELAYAAGQCGVETSALEKAAKKLEGTDLNMEGAMEQIMSLATAEERAQKASELFGDSVAYTLSPLIEQSGEDFDGLINRADELGLVMSGDAVSAGVKLGDTISDIKQSFSAMGATVGTAVIPIVQKVADLIVENLPMIQDMIGEMVPLIGSFAEALLPPLVSLAQNLLPIILDLFSSLMPIFGELMSALLPAISSLLNALLPPLIEIVEALLPPLLKIIEVLTPILTLIIEILTPIIELLAAIITPIVELIGTALTPLIELLGTLIEAGLKQLIPIIEMVASLLTNVLGGAFENLKPIIDSVTQYFSGLIDFITGVFSGDWEKAWSGVVEMFGAIFEGMVQLVKVPVNTIISAINGVFETISEIKIPDWVPLLGGKSFKLPEIPLLAKGGNVIQEGDAIVGEKGPELIHLPTGASVTPLTRGQSDIFQSDAMLETMGQILGVMQGIYMALSNYKPQVVLDTGVMCGEMAPLMDEELGKISEQNDRGLK